MHIYPLVKKTLLLVSLSVALVACGDDGSSAENWKTKQIAFKTDNAGKVFAQFWRDVMYDVAIAGRSPEQSAVAAGYPGSVGVFVVSSMQNHLPIHAAHARSFVDSSRCDTSGTVTYTGTIDDVTLKGTVKVTYEQCLENGMELDGEGVLDIHEYDLVNDIFKSSTVTMKDLSVISGGSARLMSGTMKADVDISNNRVTYISNILHKNLTGGGDETLSKDLKLIVGADSLVADGQFCVNADGCATVKTPTAMVFSGLSILPASGVLTFTGASNSMVKVNGAGNATTLLVDPEGDGTFVTATQ